MRNLNKKIEVLTKDKLRGQLKRCRELLERNKKLYKKQIKTNNNLRKENKELRKELKKLVKVKHCSCSSHIKQEVKV